MTDQKRKIIQVRNLSKFFGGVRALSNVSFDVFEEEVLGLIGPNGSGKTTLANIITGFVKPSLGDVLFKDIKISGLPPYKIADLGIARTFQIPRPFLSQKSFKNLIVPLWSPRARRFASSREGDRDAVAIDLLEEVGFERDAYVPYKLASSLPLGYLKRLELARCLALRPEVIICDEVFSGLSMSEIASMLPLIERLRMRGLTLIMIEHRLRELFTIADRVVVLNFGEKLAEGPPQQAMMDERVRSAYLGEEVTI
jgi:ABC-type branched-subunit amino acid transport system ATPase component